MVQRRLRSDMPSDGRSLLGPIFRALGMENSPFVLQKGEGRLCAARHGAPLPEIRSCALGQAKRVSASRRIAPPDRAIGCGSALDQRLLPQSDGAQFRARSGHQLAGANGTHRRGAGALGLGPSPKWLATTRNRSRLTIYSCGILQLFLP
jgi:hypothetical protein